MLASYANSLTALYISYGVIGGFGTGIIYVGIIGLVVRWFPDRRGLAAGLTAAGFGAGAASTRPRYVGRAASAATATGLISKHNQEQKTLVAQALSD